MKKILFLILFLSGLIFAEEHYVGNTGIKLDGTNAEVTTDGGSSWRPIDNLPDYYVVNGTDYAQNETGIQSAIDDCNSAGGGVVYLPAGTYNVGSTIVLKSNVRVVGSSDFATKINWTGTDTDNIFELSEATLTDTSTLLSDAVEYDTSITLSSGQGANFSANDFIYIGDTTDNYYQMNIVESVSGDTLYLKYPNSYAFPSSNTSVYKVTNFAENVSLENIKIIGNSMYRLFYLRYGKNLTINNIYCKAETSDRYYWIEKILNLKFENFYGEKQKANSLVYTACFLCYLRKHIIKQSTFDGKSNAGVFTIDRCSNIVLENLTGLNYPNLATAGMGIFISTGNVKNIQIRNILFVASTSSSTTEGIHISSSADYISICGGVIKNCTTSINNGGTNTSIVGIP